MIYIQRATGAWGHQEPKKTVPFIQYLIRPF